MTQSLRDELEVCIHGWPVEIMPCAKCQEEDRAIRRKKEVNGYIEALSSPVGYAMEDSKPFWPDRPEGLQIVKVSMVSPVTGWTCICGQDGNHFEFCLSCHAQRKD
jgi:hypothetical protein